MVQPGMPPQQAPSGGQPGQQDQGAGEDQGQMMQMLQQIVQTQDPNMALEFCNQLAQSLGQGQQQDEGAEGDQGGDNSGIPQGKKGMKMKTPNNGTKESTSYKPEENVTSKDKKDKSTNGSGKMGIHEEGGKMSSKGKGKSAIQKYKDMYSKK